MARAVPRGSKRAVNLVGSDRAGILEGTGEHGAVRVERVLELLGRPGPRPTAIFEVPTLRRREPADVTFAQLPRARRAFGGVVEPHREVASVEGERRRCRRTTTRSCTVASHAMTVLRIRHCFVPG